MRAPTSAPGRTCPLTIRRSVTSRATPRTTCWWMEASAAGSIPDREIRQARSPADVDRSGPRRPRHAVAEEDDPRAEGAGLDELEIHPSLSPREERDAPANEHRMDPDPVLVDQVQGGRLGGERRATDPDVALAGLGSQPLDLLREAPGSQAGGALDRRQGGGEHHLRERLPQRGPFEPRVVECWILVGSLPVQH